MGDISDTGDVSDSGDVSCISDISSDWLVVHIGSSSRLQNSRFLLAPTLLRKLALRHELSTISYTGDQEMLCVPSTRASIFSSRATRAAGRQTACTRSHHHHGG